MRYTVLGFDQEACVQLGLNTNDLFLMDYIQRAVGSPSMLHTEDDNRIPCVWLNHNKILEDLPILNISEERLKKCLKKLVDLDLICRVVLRNEAGKGTRAYYGITVKLEQLQGPSVKKDTCSEVSRVKKDTCKPVSRVKKDTSNNTLKNTDKRIKSFSKEKEKRTLPKANLYTQCKSEIQVFNFPEELQDKLFEYLALRLKMTDKPIYSVSQWRAILLKLTEELAPNNTKMQLKIVKQSIERGYASFFPVNSYKDSNNRRRVDKGLSCEQYTPEEEEEIRKWQKEVIANGGRIKF